MIEFRFEGAEEERVAAETETVEGLKAEVERLRAENRWRKHEFQTLAGCYAMQREENQKLFEIIGPRLSEFVRQQAAKAAKEA